MDREERWREKEGGNSMWLSGERRRGEGTGCDIWVGETTWEWDAEGGGIEREGKRCVSGEHKKGRNKKKCMETASHSQHHKTNL